jgi:hypothetical protein
MTLGVEYGLGDHMSDLQMFAPEFIPVALFYRWIFSTVAILALGLGKLAIIGYLIFIQGKTLDAKPYHKWFMYFLAASNLLLCTGMIPMLWTQCTPTAKLWDSKIVGQCLGRWRYEICGYFWSSKKIFTNDCLMDTC